MIQKLKSEKFIIELFYNETIVKGGSMRGPQANNLDSVSLGDIWKSLFQ